MKESPPLRRPWTVRRLALSVGWRPGFRPRTGVAAPDACSWRPSMQTLCLFIACMGAAWSADEPAETAPEPFRLVPASGRYHLVWRADARIKGARLLVPHAFLPSRALLATASGLFMTDDAGQQWRPLAGGTPDKVGIAVCAAFAPNETDRFYIATAGKGVWATTDGGQTFVQVGSAAKGMASDRVEALHVYPYDPRFRTLLALHGDAAPGLSRTIDGGTTWQVLAPDYHAKAILFNRAEDQRNRMVYLSAAKKDRPDVYSLWASPTLGDIWTEVAADVLAVDGAVSTRSKGGAYWATELGGILSLAREGASVERLGPRNANRWVSIGITGGATPNQDVIFAYEPTRLGLVISEDGFRTGSSQNQGLFVGTFVREGAHVRANANGTVFYAVINQALYTGRLAGSKCQILEVLTQPPMLNVSSTDYLNVMKDVYEAIREFPKTRQAGVDAAKLTAFIRERKKDFPHRPVQIVARVRVDGGKPEKVTGDLSPLGCSKTAELFDDGQHGDGAAEDGLYGVTALLSLRDYHQHRREGPLPSNGPVDFRVTAQWGEGLSDTRTGILGVFRRVQGFTYWDEWGCELLDAEGEVEGKIVADQKPRQGKHCIRLTVGTQKWRAPWTHHYSRSDLSGYHALVFWVRTDDGAQTDLSVGLRSNPDEALPAYTSSVDVVKERLVEGGGLSAEWRRVVVPLERFYREKSAFEPSAFGGVVFGGPAGPARTYFIDDIRFVAEPAELEEIRQ